MTRIYSEPECFMLESNGDKTSKILLTFYNRERFPSVSVVIKRGVYQEWMNQFSRY